ncbi:MAG: hypothetical protein PHS37_06615, partial [Candidatus Omnitrophica bacterium]|nr:hypothetical protein [Candidatus Omnitrophota bacterium]
AFLIAMYRGLGLDAHYFCDIHKHFSEADATTFCFATSEAFVIAVSGKKLGGNAQKRTRSCIFQHGSVPLALDLGYAQRFFKENILSLKADVTSLGELIGRAITFEEVAGRLADSFQKTFSVTLVESELSAAEVVLLSQRMTKKYNTFFSTMCFREPPVDINLE